MHWTCAHEHGGRSSPPPSGLGSEPGSDGARLATTAKDLRTAMPACGVGSHVQAEAPRARARASLACAANEGPGNRREVAAHRNADLARDVYHLVADEINLLLHVFRVELFTEDGLDARHRILQVGCDLWPEEAGVSTSQLRELRKAGSEITCAC